MQVCWDISVPAFFWLTCHRGWGKDAALPVAVLGHWLDYVSNWGLNRTYRYDPHPASSFPLPPPPSQSAPSLPFSSPNEWFLFPLLVPHFLFSPCSFPSPCFPTPPTSPCSCPPTPPLLTLPLLPSCPSLPTYLPFPSTSCFPSFPLAAPFSCLLLPWPVHYSN